jgi:hypothetical protein
VGADLKIGHYTERKSCGDTGTLACADVVGLGSAAQQDWLCHKLCEN